MKMPDLATTGSAMTLTRWLVRPGEPVVRGQKLMEVETDKAAMEVESAVTGMLQETRPGPGELVCAGDIIAVIETAEVVTPKAADEFAVAPGGSPVQLRTAAPRKSGGLFARNREAASQAGTSSASSRSSGGAIPLSVARRVAGRRLQHSKQTVPHFYLQTSANAGAVIHRRKAALPAKLAWDAFFVHAASRVLPRFEQLSCRFEDESLLPANTDAIGVAVDIEGDLFVIPVEAAAQKTIEQISGEILAGAAALRTNEPGSRKSKPACFTITNLGGADVETFTAIINPPEAAILAVGRIRPVVVAQGDTGFAVEQRVNLSLSVDHRVVSGRYAADFLGALVAAIEHI
jgi:pyruvate dehydrogenase E2 component (dihydrolipoamide acetyltransferase)